MNLSAAYYTGLQRDLEITSTLAYHEVEVVLNAVSLSLRSGLEIGYGSQQLFKTTDLLQ